MGEEDQWRSQRQRLNNPYAFCYLWKLYSSHAETNNFREKGVLAYFQVIFKLDLEIRTSHGPSHCFQTLCGEITAMDKGKAKWNAI